MSDENKKPSPEAELTPQVSFLRSFMKRASEFLKDPKSNLTGPARLVAEILDRHGVPLISLDTHKKISDWQAAWDKLQKTINSHTWIQAREAWNRQQENLHERINDPNHQHGSIFTPEEVERRFDSIRSSAQQEQKKLYGVNIGLARPIAESAAKILHDHAIELDATEREKFTRYGLPYHGSELVAAVNHAKEFVLHRVSNDEGQAGPDLLLPWLIL